MNYLIAAVLIGVSFIHLAPSVGMMGGHWLTGLYGMEITDPNLEILLRHRAVLFGLMGCVFLLGAWVVRYQGLALVLALVSILSFVYLALTPSLATPHADVGSGSLAALTNQMRRVYYVDLVLVGCWLVAAGTFAVQRWGGLK